VTIKIFRKLIESVNGRQIVIPLSAGYDSRLVASCLRDLNYKNVVCFSYGTSGNFEAKVAEKIARKLGYRWHFVPMTHMSEKAFLKSQDFKEYEKFSDSYNAIPYFQGLSSVKFLKENELIKDDAVFVNGNSGDFISGGHIQTFEAGRDNDCSKKNRMCHIVKKQIDKHYSLWGSEKTLHNVSKLSSMLILELESLGYTLGSVDEDYMLYEALEFHNRQSKYVIAGQKTFDFYGYDWRLPLWDKDYLDFWAKVPLNFKLDQALYKEMLFKSDFGDVWGELFPLNHKTISPSWVIPIRKLTQIPFFFFGKKGKSYWHKIEVCLFYYFMDDTHMMDYVGYLRGLRATFKFPRHHGSWQVLDYISKKVNG
jgi:asparagine synthase (glutamine-hydrolysing)